MFEARDFVRFWTKVAITAGGCAEWTGATYPTGYGSFHYKGRIHPAHRIAWLMAGGSISDGEYVLHRCDNRLCVQPSHLFVGTHKENMADMVAKGRQAPQSCQLNGNARLLPEQVKKIKADTRSHRKIAKDYGVSKTMIGLIKRGQRWRPSVQEFPK